MERERQIERALTELAAVVCENTGRGKPLSMIEVGQDTGDRSRETVRRICQGEAVPDAEWLARFSAAYVDRFPVVVLAMWAAFLTPLGLKVGRLDGGEPSFVDANGDGRLNDADLRIHEAKAAEYGNRLSAGTELGMDAAERAHLLFMQQREIEAAATVQRITAARGVVK